VLSADVRGKTVAYFVKRVVETVARLSCRVGGDVETEVASGDAVTATLE
jgi:hypothetical protein